MPDLTTPNLGLTKPEPGASENTWGAKLNANMDKVDAFASGYLRSVSALALVANEIPYATGATTAAATPLTSFARTLLDDANAATARGTLGLGAVATDNIVPVARGGTGATTVADARTSLGVYSTAQVDAAVGGRLTQSDGDGRYLRLSGGSNMDSNSAVVSNAYQGSGGNGYGYSLGANSGGSSCRIQNNTSQSNTDPSYLVFQGSSISFRVNNNGNVQNANNSYGAISDVRMKENIAAASPQLADIEAMRVVNFNMIGSDIRQIGLIAQEVQQIKPGLVDEDEATGCLSVKYSVLVPILVKAVQELSAQVRELRDAGN